VIGQVVSIVSWRRCYSDNSLFEADFRDRIDGAYRFYRSDWRYWSYGAYRSYWRSWIYRTNGQYWTNWSNRFYWAYWCNRSNHSRANWAYRAYRYYGSYTGRANW